MKTFSNVIINRSKKIYGLLSFETEWQTAIITVLILKLVTIIVATFCSYFEIYSLLLPVTENEKFATFAGIAFVLILEVLTAIFLSKAIKFTLRKNIFYSIFAGTFAVILFFISFHLATQGLAKRQAKDYDKTSTITDKYGIEKNNAINECNGLVTDLQNEITTIKRNPAGWQGAKRTILTDDQLKSIESYNDKIISLKTALQGKISDIDNKLNFALTDNKQNTTTEAKKYYLVVSFIIVLNFISNFLLMFFYSKIYSEHEKKQLIKDDLTILRQSVFNEIFSIVKGDFSTIQRTLLSSLSNNTILIEMPTNETKQGANDKKQIGFKTPVSVSSEPTPEPEAQNKEILKNDNTGVRAYKDFGIGICPNCQKEFKKQSYNHKFCKNSNCRIEFNEKKTGKDLSRFKSKLQ